MKIKLDKTHGITGFLFFIFLSSFFISSCDNPLIQKIVEPKTVTFESNGGSGVERQTVFKDQPVRRPSNPSRSGFIFAAWYRDNGTFLNEWDFAAIPNTDITLYARWNAITMTTITDVAITVTQPNTGAVPVTTASGAVNFNIGPVSWSPGDNPFNAGVQYTATVTLTAHQYCVFESALTTATINGNNAAVSNNNGNNLTLSYTFPPTRTVSGISINTPPARMAYTHGDTLDLSGLVVTINYNDGSSDNVAFGNFASRGITLSLAHGAVLSHSAHNNQSLTIIYGGFTQTTSNLTVSPKETTFTVAAIPAQAYTGSPLEPAVTVRDGTTTLTLTTDYTVTYASNTNAGTATVSISGAGNYAGSTGSASFTINPKAATLTVDAIAAQTYNESAHTPAVIVKDGAATLTLNTDYTVAYANNTNAGTATATITGTGNYAGSTGSASFTINKATGETVAAPSADTIGANSVTLNAVTAPANGQTVEYAISDTTTAPTNDSDWKTSPTFSGLTGGTTYYFFARSASNTNYEAGAASAGTPITTMQNVGITITLDVSELIDKAPTGFDSGITIYRSPGTPQTATVAITGTYDSIYWEIPGVGEYAGQSVNETTSLINLDATNFIYNSPGYHSVIVRVTIGGMEYQTSFRFRIVE